MAQSDPRGDAPRYERIARRQLTVAQVAALVEHRLHWREVDEGRLVAGCRLAKQLGLAAVLCRPDQVPAAAAYLDGSGVGVVASVGFHAPDPARLPAQAVRGQARGLTAAGATEVALVGSAVPADSEALTRLVEQVNAVRDQPASAPAFRTRVVLSTEGCPDEDVRATCQAMAAVGVEVVQGGFQARRSSLSQIELMRESLPPRVLVKWTHPVRTLEAMLVLIALGVNRFNGNPAELVTAARRQTRYAPLTVPISGLDF